MQQEALGILQWYVDAGVDEVIQDLPRDYCVAPIAPTITAVSTPAKEVPKPTSSIATPPPHHSLAAAIADARKLADSVQTLADLEKAVREFDGCAIKRTATNTVFADGNPAAKLMLIGEAPGAQEDIQGIPFCGPSGKLLDRMFGAIGYDRTSFYITNTLFWRPPGNRQPNPEELAICQPFVEKHIALIDPELLVLVGGTATKAVLGTEQGITRLRGKRFTYRTPYRDKEYPVAVVYHPSYLLRQPAQKRATWQDLLAIKSSLESLPLRPAGLRDEPDASGD